MALSRNEIENVASHYAGQYDVWERLADLEEIVKRHGHDNFYIYRRVCQIKNWLTLSENIKFTAEILSREENIFLRERSNSCSLKVIKRTKITAPLQSDYDDKIMFTMIVCKSVLDSFFLICILLYKLLFSIFNISVLT